MDQERSMRAQINFLRMVLCFVLLAGIVLVQWNWLKHNVSEVFEHIGIALIIASVLGLTIDFWLKKQITEDVFKASVGYLLPAELRDELHWLYGQRFLCTQHTQVIQLEPIGTTDFLRLVSSDKRVIKNLTPDQQELDHGLEIDEWFCDGHESQVLEYGWQTKDKKETAFEVKKKGCILDYTPKNKIVLAAGEEVAIESKFAEIRKRSDCFVFLSRWATKNPQVEIIAPEGFGFDVTFDTRDGASGVTHIGSSRYQLQSVLLPFQGMRIRWWDKAKQQTWVQAA